MLDVLGRWIDLLGVGEVSHGLVKHFHLDLEVTTSDQGLRVARVRLQTLVESFESLIILVELAEGDGLVVEQR